MVRVNNEMLIINKLEEMKIEIKKIAETFHTWKWACFILIALVAASCKEDPLGQPSTDSNPPSALTITRVDSIPGGARIYYELPKEIDILYVKGEYVSNGKQYVVRSSAYNDYLTVDGLANKERVKISLYVVDNSENASAPAETEFIPGTPPYIAIAQSIQLTPDIGGLTMRWKNPNYYEVGVVIMARDSTGQMKDYLASFSIEGAVFVQVPNEENRFGVYVTDKWGNYSDTVYSVLKPLGVAVQLDRTKMRAHFVGDDNRTDFEHNTAAYTPEQMEEFAATKMLSMFDSVGQLPGGLQDHNMYITGPLRSDGVTPWSFPFCFTMDLGVKAIITKYKFFPRTRNNGQGWEYGIGTPYQWRLFGTEEDKSHIPPDDPYWTTGAWMDDWKYMGSFTHVKPSGGMPPTTDSRGTITPSDLQYAREGVDFDILVAGVGPVRYLRFQILSVWTAPDPINVVTYMHIKELWFYGGIINE
jgi:hypothetical protein